MHILSRLHLPITAWVVLVSIVLWVAVVTTLRTVVGVSPQFLLYVLQPLGALVLALGLWWVTRDKRDRLRRTNEKVGITASVMALWAIVYFLSGLLFTYAHNPLWGGVWQMVLNLIAYVAFGVGVEYVRHRFILLIGRRQPLLRGGVVVAVFMLPYIALVMPQLITASGASVIELIGTVFIPVLVQNIVLTYLAYTAGLQSMLVYRMATDLLLLLPIAPRHDWYMVAMGSLLVGTILLLTLDRTRQDRSRVFHFRRRHINWAGESAFGLTLVGLVLFMTGVFSYHPVAIMSGSMSPIYNRGDMVVVQRYDPEMDIQKGNIVQYVVDGVSITHRVVEISTTQGGPVYTTKGDNSADNDPWQVTTDQLRGVVRGRIPLVGYPTVLLNEWMHR
ncbi:MAG TPA: signal peptidase I [Candidatus Saccharibacteria bacterium]|nr:signal peptidase I [Candidatus Saccharibacteria bacterium]